MDSKDIRQFIQEDDFEDILPFVSVIEMDNIRYRGIIINSDKSHISFIDLSKINDDEKLYDFLDLGLNWWWFSNKKIPINLYYPEECMPYMNKITHLPAKNSTIKQGHIISLQKIVDSVKPYRRNISLNSIK